MSLCVGVDGSKGRWLAIAHDRRSGSIFASLIPTPDGVITAYANADAIAVDVPIGLTNKGPRGCDLAARKLIGPRRSSVFPAPIRPVLRATSQKEASRIGRHMDGRGVGCQAWGIVPYIKAWDSLILRQDPVMAPVYEVHPEVSFFAMNKERPLLHSKRTKEGENFRRYLVTRAFGDASLNQAKAALIGQRFAADDLLDAFAALWSAKRIAKNDAVILPERPENDSHGVQMAIRY